MLSVVELFQEREEWMGQEEEVVEEKREVGCQWENPKEERKDVGCQSDSAERRDVAVQVDLLTQQLCGMAWRCVAVRAGEPRGGALLQHCGTPRSRGHTLLPIMPLCEPASCPELTQPESTDIQQTVPLPSTPPADASAAPPPGLIAPLSPRLAEEQEEEDDEVSSKKDISDSPVRVDEQSVTAETKTKSEHQVQPTPRSSPVIQRRSRRTRSGGEKISQSEERRNVRITTRDMRRNIQTGRVETRRKHTRAARGEDKNMEAEKENKKLGEAMKMKRRRRRRRSKEGNGLTPVKMNSEVTDRPRRKAVGPPIRYLLEYEEQARGKSAANHEEGRGLRGEEEKGRKEEVGRGMALKQLHLSVYRKGSRRRGTTIVRLRRLHHHNIRGRHLRNTTVSSGTQSVDGQEEKERRVQKRRRTMERDGVMVRNRKRSRREEHGREVRRRKLEEKLAQRPRRTMVGPPIRYLLESEKTHGQEKNNQDVARPTEGVTKPQKKKKTEAEGEALGDRTKTTELTEKKTESTNQDAACSHKRRVGRPKKVRVESEAVGGASGLTNLTVRTRRQQRLQRKRKSGRRCEDQMMELKRGEEEREVKEFPQRPRRTMVGPPIRYLLESEKTHGQETANQDVARVTGEVTKPQKKKTEAEGEALGDRTKTTELTEKQKESTNQDTACSHKRRVGRPKKVRVDNEPAEGTKPTGETKRERQRRKRKGESERRSGDQTKEEGGEEEREEEVKEFPQRQRRTMVGPPIRYLIELEKTHSQETASQDVVRPTEGVTKPQKKKTEAEGGALGDRTKTTALTEKQMESTNQDAACSPTNRVRSPIKVKVESEAVGGASVGTEREREELKRKERSGRKSGDWTLELKGGEEERKEEVKEVPQSQRRTMVGPPLGLLLKSEEQSHDWEVAGSGQELNSQEKTKSGGGALDQETAVIDRPEDTEQKVRQTGETDTEMKTSLIIPDGPKRRRRPVKVRGQNEEGDGASEMTDGTEIKGQRGIQRSERKRGRGTEEEEVRQVCVNDREEEKKEKQTESPKRPRRTMVGPPIRYLLESEEQSHGQDTTNQGFECMKKLLKGNEAELKAVEDMEGAKRRAGTPRKVGDDGKTGGGASERQTDIGTRTGLHPQTDLIYFDPQSGQVSIFSPCCVRLQRLL